MGIIKERGGNPASLLPHAQHRTIINNGDGSYRLMSKASSNRKCATVKDFSTASGANVFQYDYTDNAGENDEWWLERVDVSDWQYQHIQ